MSDNEIIGRNDVIAPPPDVPRGTLPPSAKTMTVIFTGLERIGKELGLPILCLLAGKWGILEPKDAAYAFISATSIVLGGNFALRKGETKGDV